jgi:hypothetical protein
VVDRGVDQGPYDHHDDSGRAAESPTPRWHAYCTPNSNGITRAGPHASPPRHAKKVVRSSSAAARFLMDTITVIVYVFLRNA